MKVFNSFHSKNRSKLCLLCLKYLNQCKNVTTKPKYMVISSNYEETIRLFITCYSFEDLRWPSVLCHTCRNLIVETKAKAKAETKEQSGNSSADKQRTKHTYDYQKITSNSITQNKVYNVKKHKHFI